METNSFSQAHGAGIEKACASMIKVAHVTIGDQTMTVEAQKIAHAIKAIQGDMVVGDNFLVEVTIGMVSKEQFDSIPELQ